MGSMNLNVMAAHLYLFSSDVGACEFIFVFASRKGLRGAGHRGNQISSAVTSAPALPANASQSSSSMYKVEEVTS